MRPSYLGIVVAALGIILLMTIVPSFGEDYLVIKKKDGSTQRVPLKFAPNEIESFRMEPGPRRSQPSQAEPRGGISGGPAEPKPLQIAPGAPPSGPKIQEKGPGVSAPPREGLGPPMTQEAPAEQKAPLPAAREKAPLLEKAPPITRKPGTGPVSESGAERDVGIFTVNLYKLPENIKALPDYSALRPEKVLSGEKINIVPAKGEIEPAGIPREANGLGLRFMGMFLVSGEGIFRWRINAKDGVRMHVDDKTLIEDDGIHGPNSKTAFTHLAQGAHSIIVDSFNSSGEPTLQLFITPPLGPEQVFSISQGLQGWREPGKPYDVLWGQVYFVPKGDYPKGPDFSKISPIGRVIAPELSISGGEGFPGLPGRKNMVGLRYEGFFNVTGAGIFAFRLTSDDYAKLTIGKHEIAEVTGGLKKYPEGRIGWAFLQKGSYPITVEYFHPEGVPRLQLFVTQPKKEEEIFSPAQTLVGFDSNSGKMNMIPAFVYFLKTTTKKIPNFNKLAPSGMFFTKAIDYPVDRGSREFPGVPRREEWLGLRFYVKFSLSEREEGLYKFRIVADDAARLIIGKKLVVNASGLGKIEEKSGEVTLKAGSHEMFLDYFQATGPNGVQLFITAPGGEEKVFAFQ